MNILLVDREYPPNVHGGVGAYNISFARVLGRLGHSVIVISTTSEKKTLVVNESYGFIHRFPYSPVPKSINRFFRWLDHLYFSRYILNFSLDLANRYHVDLIEIPSPGGHGFFITRQTKLKIPIVTRFHGTLGKIPVDKSGLNQLLLEREKMGASQILDRTAYYLNYPQWLFERSQLTNSTHITHPSEYSANWLSRQDGFGTKGYSVISNGVDFKNLNFGKNSKSVIITNREYKLICFVGRCSISKGAGVLLRAAPKIFDKVKNSIILFAGTLTDPYITTLLIEIKNKYPDRIYFPGRMSRDSLFNILSRGHVLALPTFYETSSMAAIEAMALGIPVVASNIGPLQEIVKDKETGLLFPAGDEDALADAIQNLLCVDGQYLKIMKEACIARARDCFDLEKLCRKILLLYSEIVNNDISKNVSKRESQFL